MPKSQRKKKEKHKHGTQSESPCFIDVSWGKVKLPKLIGNIK